VADMRRRHGRVYLAAGGTEEPQWRLLMASKSTSRLANKTTAVVTAVGLLAVTTIGAYEGLRLNSYRDVIGVWTYCYGETKGAHAGMKFTKAQCDVLFVERLGEFETG